MYHQLFGRTLFKEFYKKFLITGEIIWSFCGMVNYMSMFLPSLQEILIPIYSITRKGIPFCWGDEQQKVFEDIKNDVTNAPVLLMPNSTGHFVLVSDTSKIGCGAALYQKQSGKYHLVAYYSKIVCSGKL